MPVVPVGRIVTIIGACMITASNSSSSSLSMITRNHVLTSVLQITGILMICVGLSLVAKSFV